MHHTTPDLHLALVQADIIWEDIAANLEQYERLLAELPAATNLIVLPEMFQTGFSMNPALIAEPPNGHTTQWLQNIARTRGSAICGSVATALPNGNYCNRLLWVMPNGEVHFYDKKHLFRMGQEQSVYTSGSLPPLRVQYLGWQISGLVCYDLRFPVWARNRFSPAQPAPYDLLLYVANWPAAREQAWQTLLRARAIENLCYVVGVNRAGTDAANNYHSGGSLVSDYVGNVGCMLQHQAGISLYSLQKAALDHYRQSFAAWLDADDFQLL